MTRTGSFFSELQRRHVYKVGAAYCVAGWLLVQIVTQVFPIFDVSALVQRIIVLVIVAGFPPALVLAWIFDITPQGIVRTPDLSAAGEAPAAVEQRRTMDRKLNYVLGGLLLIALAHRVIENRVWHQRPAPSAANAPIDASIAVLPFANTSDDSGNEYFSDGLSDELISVLAKIPDLKVIGRTSSFHFKNSNEDSRGIGTQLGVATLLEGSVRKQGDRVRVVAELVSAADGRDLWSETYDRELKDVFAVQSEIAAAVAAQLKLKLLGGSDAPQAAAATQSLPAYNALLQGDFYRAQLTPEDQLKAVDYYNEAIRLDPGYALAYARLSRTWRALAAIWLDSAKKVADGYAEARRAANRALELNPDLGEAHHALGWLLATPDLDFPAAEVEMRRAVTLAPADADARNGLAYVLAAQGRLTESLKAFEEAGVLDPLAVAPKVTRAHLLLALGRLDQADVGLRQAIALQPHSFHLYVYVVWLDLLRGDAAAARRDAELEQEGFWRDYERTLATQAQPDRAVADAALNRFIATRASTGLFQIAELYAYRQQPDAMFEWLDRAFTDRDSGMTLLMSSPFIGRYRDDPRFVALCGKLKIDLKAAERLP